MARFKLVFFAPSAHTARIVDHLFKKHPQHLGKIGHYDQCAFITPGLGQFKPGPNATPSVGSTGVLEKVEEHRVEILVLDQGDKTQLNDAITALKEIHPYEQVAYDVYRLEDI